MAAGIKSTKLHIAMFPWFAFGHMIPYLHMSNKLAERGHQVSFLLPRGAKPQIQKLSLYQDLINFFPLDVPHIDGLPPGAETTSDVPFSDHTLLGTALDQTRDQVLAILSLVKPNVIFIDFSCWIPTLARNLGIKSIYYAVVCAAAHALFMVPGIEIPKDSTLGEGPCDPSLKLTLRPHEAKKKSVLMQELGSGLSLYERLTTGMRECNAIAFRTCHEIEGPFCDYIANCYAKPVLLSGPGLPETVGEQLEERWNRWLSNFKPSSVVFCAFGSQLVLEKGQFQELLLGFELAQLPFLVALKPPQGCATIEEALPNGFAERVKGRGIVHGGWIPQTATLEHPSIGCFVNHCGYGTMWESLVSDCQIVLIPYLPDQIINARLMVDKLKVAVEVDTEETGWITKESLCKAVRSVMDEESNVASEVKSNHAKWKEIISSRDLQRGCIDSFISNLQNLLD